MTIEEIREMLADLPPSEWKRHMAEVTARESALTADRDRWKRRAAAWKARADVYHDNWQQEQNAGLKIAADRDRWKRRALAMREALERVSTILAGAAGPDENGYWYLTMDGMSVARTALAASGKEEMK